MVVLCMIISTLVAGCLHPTINLYPDTTEKLQEFTLEGKGRKKVLLIPVHGMITDRSNKSLLKFQPSTVEEVVARLKLAEQDKQIRAVLLEVNSPGGTTTASDILYQELSRFKARTGVVLVSAMMDLATSGAYYISLPADWIVAHPTTVTGSIGAVFLRPQITGLMDKIGLDIQVYKSGVNKDMGSPFRKMKPDEMVILNKLIREQGQRFLYLTAKRRGLSGERLEGVATARIYTASEALALNLVDEVGYLPDAISKAKSMASLPDDARVVVYRRTRYGNDNVYNTANLRSAVLPESDWTSLLERTILVDSPGFYYLWMPGLNPL